MTSALPAPPRTPAAPVAVFVCAVALVLGGGVAAWLLWPGQAPSHRYGATGPEQATFVSRSYDRGPDSAGAADASTTPTPSPVPLPADSAEQAAVAAAALAGTDAAQITADGFALTSEPQDPPPGEGAASFAPPAAPARVPMIVAPARLVVPEEPLADSLGPTGGAESTAQLQADAYARMLDHGFGEDQWSCLDRLITRESGWHVAATNIRSGAYGLPQALPATKMATAGADWRTNPHTQLAWMLDYVQRRYTDPCGAWAHEVSAGWY